MWQHSWLEMIGQGEQLPNDSQYLDKQFTDSVSRKENCS